jgi:hypothetical protein
MSWRRDPSLRGEIGRRMAESCMREHVNSQCTDAVSLAFNVWVPAGCKPITASRRSHHTHLNRHKEHQLPIARATPST